MGGVAARSIPATLPQSSRPSLKTNALRQNDELRRRAAAASRARLSAAMMPTRVESEVETDEPGADKFAGRA